MEKSLSLKSHSLIIATILATIMSILLIIMAFFNEPIADQYDFMSNIHQYGVLGYTGIMYSSWSGRLVQVPILGLMYKIFGDGGAQIFFPIILLCSLAGAFSMVTYQLAGRSKSRAATSVALGLFFAAGTLYTTSCLFDIYLWLDAAVVYLLGIIAVVYDFGVLLWLIRNAGKLRQHKFILIIMLAIALILQTAGETSMVICLGWSFVLLFASFVVKRWHQYRAPLALLFAAVLIGSLIMILSPGLWARASQASADISNFSIFITRPLSVIKNLFLDISIWQAALIALTGIIISQVFSLRYIKKAHLKIYAAISVLVIITFCYFPTVVYFYGNHATNIESRALAIQNMGIFLGCSMLVAILCSWISRKLLKSSRARTFTFIGSATLLLLVFIPGFLYFNKAYFSILVTRENLVNERVAAIEQYQNGETASLVVPDAPVMILNSGATDFTANGWVNVDWFYNAFVRYYNLNPDDVMVYGEELVLPETKQDWYTEKSRNICTESNQLIYEKYYCHNQ